MMKKPSVPFTFTMARPEDAATFVLLENQARAGFMGEPIPNTILWPESTERIKQRLAEPATWSQIAYDGVRSVAFVFGYPADNKHGNQYMDMLMVHPDYWGQGLASELVDWAAQNAKTGGAENLSLLTASDNVRARQLYERLGFIATDLISAHSNDQNLPVEFVLKI